MVKQDLTQESVAVYVSPTAIVSNTTVSTAILVVSVILFLRRRHDAKVPARPIPPLQWHKVTLLFRLSNKSSISFSQTSCPIGYFKKLAELNSFDSFSNELSAIRSMGTTLYLAHQLPGLGKRGAFRLLGCQRL